MRLIEFKDRFPTEQSCVSEFRRLREKSGIICKRCKGIEHYWLSSKQMYQCKNSTCRFRTSLKSGTVLENSKLPYMFWFITMHLMTSSKNNMSALEIQRQLGLKYYEPVFEMMHKIRLVMGKRDDIYDLVGEVELDEGYFSNSNSLERNEFTGEVAELKRGKGSQKKTPVLVMHSFVKAPLKLEKSKHKINTIPKFIKMKVLENVTSKEITSDAEKSINKNSNIVSDDNKSYNELQNISKTHTSHKASKTEITKILPWVHKAITNSKGIIMNVHKGISDKYMQNYMNEYCFKFNRRQFNLDIFDRLILTSVLYTWF